MTEEPTPTFDLERLKALRAKATQGEWLNGERIMPDDRCDALRYEEHADIYRVTEDGNCNIACATFDAGDADFVVALVNAFPAMVEELERLRRTDGSGCPCKHTTPCNPRCTCVMPGSSSGCARCCSYGSKEQQRAMAERLAALVRDLEEQRDYFRSRSLALEASAVPATGGIPNSFLQAARDASSILDVLEDPNGPASERLFPELMKKADE